MSKLNCIGMSKVYLENPLWKLLLMLDNKYAVE